MKIANGMLLFHNKAEIYSNWYLRPVTIKGVMFNCLEQYLMFAKAKLFGDEVRAEEIMATPDPAEQKAIGRKVEGYVDAIWIVRRGTILWHGVYAKFTQHEDMKAELLGTDDLLLVEASGSDSPPRSRYVGNQLANLRQAQLARTKFAGRGSDERPLSDPKRGKRRHSAPKIRLMPGKIAIFTDDTVSSKHRKQHENTLQSPASRNCGAVHRGMAGTPFTR